MDKNFTRVEWSVFGSLVCVKKILSASAIALAFFACPW
jgi:hypothetical protein